MTFATTHLSRDQLNAVAHAAANQVHALGARKSPEVFAAGQIALAKATLGRLKANRVTGAWRPLHARRELAMAALRLAAMYRRNAAKALAAAAQDSRVAA